MITYRLALRGLFHAPWFAASVIVVLTVGMTLAIVAFAVVERALFRSLPFDRPGELFVLRAASGASARQLPPVSAREIDTWARVAPELSSTTIAAQSVEFPIDGIRARMAAIDGRFLDVLGVRPILGGFAPEDFQRVPDESEVRLVRPVLLTHRFWRTLTGGDPQAVGQTRVISERGGRVFAFRIAGVLPQGFVFPLEIDGGAPDLLTPIVRNPGLETRREFHLVFRVPPSIDMAGLRSRLDRTTVDLAVTQAPGGLGTSHREARAQAPFDRVTLEALGDWVGAQQRSSSRFLFWTALGLLAVACLNAAGLAAARNLQRQGQLLLCRALGASVWDLGTLLLVEGCVLAGLSAAAAFALARPLLLQTLLVLPESMVFGEWPAITGRAAIATVLLALLSVLGVSSWPLVLASRFGSAGAGRPFTSSITSIQKTRRGSGHALIAIQVAGGFVFVIAGVLSVASLGAVLNNDAGFQRDRMILLEGAVKSYVSRDDARQQLEDSVALLRRLPGVQRVAVSTIQSTFLRETPIAIAVIPEGWSTPSENVTVRQVSHDFFETMGLRLIEGHWPAAGQWSASGSPAIVSAAVARSFWPDGRALGRTLTVGQSKSTRTVIAVVADARFAGLDVEPTQDIYLPEPIVPGRTGLLYHVRTAGPAEAALPLVVRELSAAGVRIDRAATHARGLFDTIKDRALPAWLFGLLATGALGILTIGVAGLLAMTSAQRTREIGIRLALGATRSRVVTTILKQPLVALIEGLIAGSLASWWLVRYLDSQLYATASHDPALWTLAALLIAAVAAGAAAVPAVRASRINPLESLRAE